MIEGYEAIRSQLEPSSPAYHLNLYEAMAETLRRLESAHRRDMGGFSRWDKEDEEIQELLGCALQKIKNKATLEKGPCKLPKLHD